MKAIVEILRNTFVNPLKEFIHDSRAIGITLLACTFISIFLSNIEATSVWYRSLWSLHWGEANAHHYHIGWLSLPSSILVVINDCLMTIFFFLAGMEIKRELMCGELASIKKSILPVVGAVGGMFMPAFLFSLMNKGTFFMQGWAIPTATDIAFTLGVASLLGTRVPIGLKIFITALAIIDDLGAILVIALFYGDQIQFTYMLLCGLIVGILYYLNKKDIFNFITLALGIALWYCMFNSGIHATIAGVIMAFLIPMKRLSNLEMKIHMPVYFIIMPLFALANTAIVFPDNSFAALGSSLSLGILFGLVIGKPLGICLASYILVKNKWANLPSQTNWFAMIGASMLAGIGFTMSIFISTLAFEDPTHQDTAKMAVFLASSLAILFGYTWLSFSKKTD